MKHFPILQGRAYVVELPEGAHTFNIINGYDKDGEFSAIRWETMGWFTERLPPGTWQIVGLLPEVTEEQAAGIVDYNEDIRYYRAYGVHPVESGDGKRSRLVGYLDAIKSLESAIHAEGYYLDENPKRIKDHDFFYDGDGGLKDEELYIIECESEAEAQSRVLCRERCLILRRVDG